MMLKTISKEELLLYCMKISRHENFTVSRFWPKNREIKVPRKMILELDREIKMPRKTNFSVNRELKMHKKIRCFPVFSPFFSEIDKKSRFFGIRIIIKPDN